MIVFVERCRDFTQWERCKKMGLFSLRITKGQDFLLQLKLSLLRRRYLDKEGGPKRCYWCESTSLASRCTATAGDNVVAEEEVNCGDCSLGVGYWAYGYWQPVDTNLLHYFKKKLRKKSSRF